MARPWLWACLVTGCGRIAFDPLASPDACQLGDFGPAQPMSAINSAAHEYRPSLTPDQLTLLFASDRDGTFDLFQATRTSPADPFGDVTKLDTLSSAAVDVDPAVTADGLALYFASTRNGAQAQLFRSIRSDPGAAWQPPAVVAELATIEVYAPVVSSDGSELLFCQMNPTFQIARAVLAGGAFTVVGPVAEVGAACAPALSADDTTLYYEDHTGAHLTIATATRAAIGAPWTDLMPLAGYANPAFDQGDAWPSRDGTTLYLVTNQTGSYDLYTATRGCQ